MMCAARPSLVAKFSESTTVVRRRRPLRCAKMVEDAGRHQGSCLSPPPPWGKASRRRSLRRAYRRKSAPTSDHRQPPGDTGTSAVAYADCTGGEGGGPGLAFARGGVAVCSVWCDVD